MDRMIAATVTALSPAALKAWGDRKRRELPASERTDEDRLRARDRMLAMLGSSFPGSVKVS